MPMPASQNQSDHSKSDCEMHHALEDGGRMLQSCTGLHEEVLRLAEAPPVASALERRRTCKETGGALRTYRCDHAARPRAPMATRQRRIVMRLPDGSVINHVRRSTTPLSRRERWQPLLECRCLILQSDMRRRGIQAETEGTSIAPMGSRASVIGAASEISCAVTRTIARTASVEAPDERDCSFRARTAAHRDARTERSEDNRVAQLLRRRTTLVRRLDQPARRSTPSPNPDQNLTDRRTNQTYQGGRKGEPEERGKLQTLCKLGSRGARSEATTGNGERQALRG